MPRMQLRKFDGTPVSVECREISPGLFEIPLFWDDSVPQVKILDSYVNEEDSNQRTG